MLIILTKMMKISIVIMSLIWFVVSSCDKEEQTPPEHIIAKPHKIIPLPYQVNTSSGELKVNQNSGLFIATGFERAGEIIKNAFYEKGININSATIENSVVKVIKDVQLDKEQYRIDISEKEIVVKAGTAEGAFYAAQTIRLLLWNADLYTNDGYVSFSLYSIEDYPKHAYRGFHIDLSRHFFSKDYILKIIDQMALYKLNKLQLHLTDDQGWRIQLDNYPNLTSVGAYRELNKWDLECIDRATYDADYNLDTRYLNGNIYGGFYTKQDIIDIIAYANDNFIEVIPEIDMPGHMSAAIRSYPDLFLSCSGNTNWGDEFSEPINVCNADVMQFVYNVWDEIIELFPSETVHIGADEVDKSFWEDCETCQQFMQENNMNHINQVQSYFVDLMYSYFSSKGKKMIAWDDILVSNNDNIVNNVNPDIDIMYWRDYKPESSVYAAQNGNNIILTPWSWFYLSSAPSDESLKKLYDFDELTELDANVLAKKIGYQACVWTELIPSEKMFERHVFPRFQAFAELSWSNIKAWHSFTLRMDTHLDMMDKNNFSYTNSEYFR